MPEATPDGNIAVIRSGTVLPFDGSDRVIDNGEALVRGRRNPRGLRGGRVRRAAGARTSPSWKPPAESSCRG